MVTVNGEKIDKAEIDAEVERLRADYKRYVRDQEGEADEDQLQSWSKENVIERVLIRQEAAKSDIEMPQKEIEETYKRAEEYFKKRKIKKPAALAEVENQLKAEKMVAAITAGAEAPTDEEIEAFYDEHHARFVEPEQVAVRHIEKKVQDPSQKDAAYVELLNVHERIRKGEPFEELAAQYSDCSGFDIGYFPRGQMVQEFEDIVFALKKDEISEVFQTQFGYHIAKVYDRREGGAVELDRVRDQIREQLVRDKRNKAVEAFVDGLRAKATISE